MSQRTKRIFPTWRRLLVPLLIWVTAGALTAGLYRYLDGDRTSQIMVFYIVPPTAVFLTLVWWIFFSGILWKVRIGVLATLGVLTAPIVWYLFTFVIRFDSFRGGFVPLFSLRSKPTAEQDFAKNYQPPVAQRGGDALTVQPGDWPQFRGPNRDGIVADKTLRTKWNGELPRQIWRQKIGPGWGSCCVVDGFVFTQMQIDQDEAVVCYELASGQPVWEYRDQGVRFEEFRAGIGPMATPAFANGRIYTLGATGLLNCLNAETGQQIWQKNIVEDAGTEVLEWSMTGSPLVHNNQVYVIPGSDGETPGTLTIYDAETGKQLATGGLRAASYSSPTLATIDGVEQILVFDAYGLAGHHPESAERLWEFPWTNNVETNVALPIVYDDGIVFLANGYTQGSALISVSRGTDGRWIATPTGWKTQRRFQLKFGDAVREDRMIYGLNETRLAALNVDSGDIEWQKRGSFGFGQILFVDGMILTLSEDGIVKLIDPRGKQQPEVLKFDAFPDLDGAAKRKTWNHPSYVRGLLLVRNAAELACYDLRKKAVE